MLGVGWLISLGVTYHVPPTPVPEEPLVKAAPVAEVAAVPLDISVAVDPDSYTIRLFSFKKDELHDGYWRYVVAEEHRREQERIAAEREAQLQAARARSSAEQSQPDAVHTVRGSLSEGEMIALLDAVGMAKHLQPAALRVAWCESSWNPNATGAAGERGLWQIMPYWHQAKADALFGAGANLYDPLVNAATMMVISSDGTNWSAWTCRP